MKKGALRSCEVVALWAVCLLLTACAGVPAGSERVLSFQSKIAVQPDSTLAVRETIKVRSSGILLQHGLFREFPGAAADPAFRITDVLLDGQPAPHFTRDAQGGLRLYVGSEDELLPPGEHTFVIAFRTSLGLRTEGPRCVLRRNVTGQGWPFPIDSVSATVDLPASVPRDSVQVAAYIGAPKALKQDVAYSVGAGGRVQLEARRALGIGESIQVIVSWPAAAAVAAENGRATAAWQTSAAAAPWALPWPLRRL
jgi:hypothetical protein